MTTKLTQDQGSPERCPKAQPSVRVCIPSPTLHPLPLSPKEQQSRESGAERLVVAEPDQLLQGKQEKSLEFPPASKGREKQQFCLEGSERKMGGHQLATRKAVYTAHLQPFLLNAQRVPTRARMDSGLVV